MKSRYNVSEAFKESCKANIGLNRYGRIHVVEDDLDIVGENYNGQLVDFTIEDNCYVKDTFVGTTVAKKITVNILNPDNSINLENKTIEAYVGIYIDGELEEIPYGTYIIEKPEDEEVKEKTNFTGYDYMIKFNVPYQDRVTYPIKASKLFEDVCNQIGLQVGSTDFINADYMILGNPFTNNEDCRTVLSNIAQLAGTFAKIGRDNKVYISSLKNLYNILEVRYVDATAVQELDLTLVQALSGEQSNSEETLDGMNYYEDFSKNAQWGGLNSLVLGLSSADGENTAVDDRKDINENGLTEITIQDNYFLENQEEREKVIVPLWNNLKGLKYIPFKTEYYGYPYLDVGDMIYIQDTKDNGYISYVFNHKFTFNGSFKGSLETPALTKTQTAYKNTFNMKTRFRRAERSIDKINGVIEDIIEEQDEYGDKLSQYKQELDRITQRVSSALDFESHSVGKNQLVLADSLDSAVMKFVAYAENTDTTYFSENLKFGTAIFPKFAGQTITVVIDTQSRTKKSDNVKEYKYSIEPMLKYRDINDQFVIERNTDDSYCTVKILRYVSKEGDIYTTYTTPKEEILDTKLDIRLFKDTTYIYLDEYTTWNMECSYINGSNINEYYASKTDMETKIEQTEEKITQSATKTLEDIDTARQEAIDEANKNTAKSLENYSTKEDTDNAKKEAIDSANTNTEDKLKSYPTKIEMNSAIEQSAESIKSTVSQTYSTKTEVVQAKEEAISSANSSTDEKLEGYSTNADTEQAKKDAISSANSATDNKLKSYSTTTDSDKKYSTKAETNTAKQEAIDSANSSTDEKLQDYSTSTDTEQAKNDAIKSANDATDEKLKKYSTTTQMESAINQKADSITSSVSATYTTKEETATAKEEAISSANSSTDTKLKNYTETTKLGTVIEQNAEAIRIAWNQISQFLKLEGIDGKASLNIYDGTNNLLLTLDDDGETFYDKSGKVLGEIGLVTEYANELLNGTTLAFSVPVNDWKDDSTKMAWGLKNKEGKFLPIFYMSSFAGAEQSEYGGKLNIAGELYASSVKANLEMLLSNQASLAWYSDIENPSTNSGYIRVHASSNTHLVTGLAFGYGDDEFLVINGHDNCIGIYKPFAVSGFVGYPMIGLDANHKYYVNWHDGSYDFYVDGQYFGALSDKRLKSDFKSIDDKFLQAIDELEIQQFKIDNKCGKISWGIVAQDLIEVFKKYDINPKDYEILQEVQYKLDDDTMYYRIEYQQFLVLKQLASDRKVQKLENEIKKQNKVMQELLKRIEKLEGGKQ